MAGTSAAHPDEGDLLAAFFLCGRDRLMGEDEMMRVATKRAIDMLNAIEREAFARGYRSGTETARDQAINIAIELYDEAPSAPYDNGGTKDGWEMACRQFEEACAKIPLEPPAMSDR